MARRPEETEATESADALQECRVQDLFFFANDSGFRVGFTLNWLTVHSSVGLPSMLCDIWCGSMTPLTFLKSEKRTSKVTIFGGSAMRRRISSGSGAALAP